MKAEKYTIYRAPGWHGEPEDPVIGTTNDEREAAMTAGCRADLGMPGNCNPHDCYATDEDGKKVDRIESYRCGDCDELIEWGDGPTGMMGGEILECAGAVESHLVTWVCEGCAEKCEVLLE